MIQRTIGALLLLFFACSPAASAPPHVTNDRYELERIAIEPEIVTPTGMAFDSQGRLLVIESHTHQRPSDYEGPTGDRIRMLSDSDGDGRLDRWSTFAKGFRHAMNLLAREDGAVYLVERGRVLLLRDTDNDDKTDVEEVLLRLETEDDYPHNALGGIAQQSNGSLVLGLGENHGLPFRLIGADDKEIFGTGGLDGFFRCTGGGTHLEHFARGVWNPFSLCVLPDGRIFAVDNDPDSSPPCRLLHVVEGGDYGYLYQYGRAGTHPLQAWNGELPGTLPMVCGTGEAPTAVVAHAGSLWVTSWGDHRIERYRLIPRGASYGAKREIVVQGDADFRPTGMAVAPDGSLYFGDWVLRDYPVHGKGRIWRLEVPSDSLDDAFPDDEVAAATTNTRSDARYVLMQSDRFKGIQGDEPLLKQALADDSPDVRLYAVRWIADDRITSLRDGVAKLLEGPQPSTRYYLAVLAALDWLDHEPSMRGTQIADELLVRELRNEKRSPEAHTLALRLLSPDNKVLSHKRLLGYLQSEHKPLRLEAVRSLSQRSNPERFGLLASVADDESQDDGLRAEAVVGLAADAEHHRDLLERLAETGGEQSKSESARVLRLAKLRPAPKEDLPPAEDLAAWNELLAGSGDPTAGRRLFFSPIGPRCGVCHEFDGRGGRTGPDLTYIARSNNREQIIASVLQPSREVAPHYQPWLLVTNDGKTHTGLRQHKSGDNGMEDYVDSAGVAFSLPSDTIEERRATETSIMPDGLQSGMTIEDLRDLMAFLTATE